MKINLATFTRIQRHNQSKAEKSFAFHHIAIFQKSGEFFLQLQQVPERICNQRLIIISEKNSRVILAPCIILSSSR